MLLRQVQLLIILLLASIGAMASKIIIPMDAKVQTNHLKAYGVVYNYIAKGNHVQWLLNFKGGSFLLDNDTSLALQCVERRVQFETMTDREAERILRIVRNPNFDGTVVELDRAARIAVYTPNGKEPWDDAVTLALTYAEIPFDKIYIDEVMNGALGKYDWLHLHHQDFTGQYGKFWSGYRNAEWYIQDKAMLETLARKYSFKKVQQLHLAVVKRIRSFVEAGGNLFAMCTATETFDIALAADGVDICDSVFDGDKVDPNVQKKLNYSKCLAFKGFTIYTSPYELARSDVDNSFMRPTPPNPDRFRIHAFSAKTNTVPALLTQNHVSEINGFMGQSTAFKKQFLKPDVIILADNNLNNEARFIHGELGKGTWTFFGGHDPECYRHNVGDPPTDLSQHPSSPGYRLILNNVLFASGERAPMQEVTMATAAKEPTEEPAADPRNTLTASKYRIFPNMNTNELDVTLPATNEEGEVNLIETLELQNQDGKVVAKKECHATKASIPMGDLPTGVYIVKVNGNYAGKVVKE